jgi:pyruvate dehydrogenase E2 component (dihydrolipoamide acetyltransferase)
MTDIVMPRLSDTMEEGTILRWLKGNGEEVARGDELVEIETDKANMTYESDQAGLLQILAAVGDTLAVGQVIARIGTSQAGAHDGTPTSAKDKDLPSAPSAPSAPAGADKGGGAQGAGAVGERVRASPLARRMASESGIDLHAIIGSGPGGRIVKADVVGGQPGARAEPAPARAGTSPAPTSDVGAIAQTPAAPAHPDGPTLEGVMTAKGQTTDVDLSRTQQTVARRMAESKATIPDFTLQIEVDMEACVRLRTQLKQLSKPGSAPPPPAPPEAGGRASEAGAAHEVPTYNDMVVKACALALREHRLANASYRDGRVQVYSRVNVGVAVAAEGALVVPTVFDADEKSVGEIARETRALAERVRSGAITPPELGGGTFTVSNLGMYRVRSFTAIINPPQAGILSVGVLEPRAVVREGEVVARNTMMLVLACDHRIFYGAEAAQFLARIRELLEAPASLTL